MGVRPEREGVDVPAVLDLARSLKVGGGVGRGHATRAEKEHARDLQLQGDNDGNGLQKRPFYLGLRAGRVLEEDAALVAGGGNGVQVRVVDL